MRGSNRSVRMWSVRKPGSAAREVWMLSRNRLRGTYRTWVNRYVALTRFAAGRLIARGTPQDHLEVIRFNALSCCLILQREFPGLKWCGVFSPPFRPWSAEEGMAVVACINDADPDVLVPTQSSQGRPSRLSRPPRQTR